MDVKLALTLVIAGLMLAAGCGENRQAESDTVSPLAQTTVQQKTTDASELLIGTWYGRAQLDSQALARKLEQTSTVDDRSALNQLATIFQTTEIAARFDRNGQMELDVEIRPGDQVLRDSTKGTWRLIEATENAVIVETTEPLPAGGTETNRVRYEFRQQGQYAVMVAPTNQQLADCYPVFVFQRVQDASESIANSVINESLK